MPLRGPVELESHIHTRLHNFVHNHPVTGEDATRRLMCVTQLALKMILVEMAGGNMIPPGLIKEDIQAWAERISILGLIGCVIDLEKRPQIELDLKPMTVKIFENYLAPRIPVSPFVRPGVGFKGLLAQSRIVRDETLSLELEERGLREIILPKTDARTEGRRRIGEGVQKALAEVEQKRQKELEEQRKIDKEAKDLEDTGFGRKVDLD